MKTKVINFSIIMGFILIVCAVFMMNIYFKEGSSKKTITFVSEPTYALDSIFIIDSKNDTTAMKVTGSSFNAEPGSTIMITTRRVKVQ